MAQPGFTSIAAPINTTAAGDTYPTHLASRGLDDSAVATFTDLALIEAPRLAEGMARYVLDEQSWYILEADLTTWTLDTVNGIVTTDIMLKSDFAPAGTVVNALALQGSNLASVLDRANHTGTQAIAATTGLQAALDAKIPLTQKGAANGVVPLTAGTLIDPIYLPISSPIDPVEEWDVITNTPTLADGGVFTAGNSYIVTVSANPTARDLGSGSQNWSDGDLAIYTAGNIFIRVPRAGVGVSQVTTALGVQTGAVTIDDTTYIDPSADRNYVTDDQLAAFPVGADATDQLVLQSDLASVIVVGNGFFMPELYANNETLGDGTLRTLTSLGYNNGSAAAIWTRVNSAYTIDVNTMDIDWIAHQEAMLTMQALGYSSMITPGGRGYCPYTTIQMPRHQTAVPSARRSQIWKFDFNTSTYNNVTGVSFPCFEKMPANQAQAEGLEQTYQYMFYDAKFFGNDTDEEDDCFIRLGGTVSSIFKNIVGEDAGIVIDAQFCLQPQFENINTPKYGKYGIAIRGGQWSGADANNSQSNNATIRNFHSSNDAAKTPTAAIFCEANRNISIETAGFEGSGNPEHHFLYNQVHAYSGTTATSVKNCVKLFNLDLESCGASRAAIRIIGSNLQAQIDTFYSQVGPPTINAFVESDVLAGGISNYIYVRKNSTWNSGFKFRNRTIDSKWIVGDDAMNDMSNLRAAVNWATDFGGTIPPADHIRFTPVVGW